MRFAMPAPTEVLCPAVSPIPSFRFRCSTAVGRATIVNAKIVAGLGLTGLRERWRALAVHSRSTRNLAKGPGLEMQLTIEGGEHNG